MKTITVAELIELLQEQEPDAKVIFATDYGDYGHTTQAHALQGEFEEVGCLVKTAYSSSGYAIPDERYEEPTELQGKFLVLS